MLMELEVQSEQIDFQFHRSRNVGRNMVFGLLNRCVGLLLPFIVRTVLIYRFGALYLGMNSLLGSIFQVLNLAELGFGSAVVYSLYKPVAEGDTETVCAYLGTYRKIYRVIGLVILAAGLAVMPFFPRLVKDSPVPGNMNLFTWYLIFLADAVVSYLLYGYKTAIPSALQREDLLSKIDTAVLVCKSVVQMACLLLTDNFYFYLLTSLLFTVLRNLLISHVVDRRFPQYVCRGNISEGQFGELKRLVGGLALSKFRGASRHAIDSICITVFVSLTMTAVYSNYFLIHSAVVSLSGILCGTMVASVGNSIATESREKNYRDMRRFNFIYMLLAGWAMICLLCLYQPFVRLWMGGALSGGTMAAGEAVVQGGVAAGEALMLGMPEVVALCLYFYLLKAGDMRWIYHQGAGLWWKARYIVIAEILSNVVLNILLAKYWGVLGIILATLISLFFINFLGGAWILFKEYFRNGKLGEFFVDQALYFGVTVAVAVVCWWACESVSEGIAGVAGAGTVNVTTHDYLASVGSGVTGTLNKGLQFLQLLLRLVACTVISVLGYYLIYRHTARYQDAKEWIRSRFWRRQ